MKVTKHITLLIVLLPIVACFPADMHVDQIGENVPTLLNLTKCCNEGEAFDINTRSCFQMESVSYDYLMDLFYYSMIDTNSDYDNLLSPNGYNIIAFGKPTCHSNEQDRQIVINPNEPGSEQFIIEYPSGELFEIYQYKYHQNYCLDVAYGNGQYWGIAGLFCNQDLHFTCQNKKCLSFCCQPGLVYDAQIGDCRPAVDFGIYRALPQMYDEDTGTKINFDDNDIEFIYGVPECFKSEDVGYATHQVENNTIFYNNDGHLKVGSGYFNYQNSCVVQVEQFEEGSNTATYLTQANICAPTRVNHR